MPPVEVSLPTSPITIVAIVANGNSLIQVHEHQLAKDTGATAAESSISRALVWMSHFREPKRLVGERKRNAHSMNRPIELVAGKTWVIWRRAGDLLT